MPYEEKTDWTDVDAHDEDLIDTNDDFGTGLEGGGGEIAEDSYDDESDADTGAESISDDSIVGVIV